VTHAWNALPFHHREPGPLGAALGNPDIHVELILDQIHVDPTLIRWTLALHPESTCFVSDCVPAAATTPGTWHSFGSLQIRLHEGAGRLKEGHLAGGGLLLDQAYLKWLKSEAAHLKTEGAPAKNLQQTLLKKTLPYLTTAPLKALRIPKNTLQKRRLSWKFSSQGDASFRIDSLVHDR